MAFFELGLGRPRVLSRQGREAAATRWYEGEHGPRAAVAAQAQGVIGQLVVEAPTAPVWSNSVPTVAPMPSGP